MSIQDVEHLDDWLLGLPEEYLAEEDDMGDSGPQDYMMR